MGILTTGRDPAAARPPVCLASSSPRRAALLRTLGVEFSIVTPDVDERPLQQEQPESYVLRLARNKALNVSGTVPPEAVIIAADTCVTRNGAIYGKPLDLEDARTMLKALSGAWHEVHTAIATCVGTQAPQGLLVTTRVQFAALSDSIIDAYWASGEPADKAGAYGIQGLGGALVRRIEGSYSAVVGLPLAETASILSRHGVPTTLSPS